MDENRMDRLIEAIRLLKKEKKTYEYIDKNQDEIRITLDLWGLNGGDDGFFESVKKSMKMV